jgi:altronate dehydratase
MATFEGSSKDIKEDKKLAKKNKMSMSDWEKSPKDTKHDKQKSMKGLKKGGVTSLEAKKMGRNLARVANQKSTGRGR